MTPFELLPWLGGLVVGVLLALIGSTLYLRARRRTAVLILAEAETKAAATLQRAGQDADQAKSAAVLEGKMEVLRLREEGDRDLSRRRDEADRAERRAEEREKGFAKRGEQLEQQEKSMGGRLSGLERQELGIKVREAEIEVLIREQHIRLERVAGLTAEEAKRELLQKVEDEARAQAGALGREIREQAKKDAERDAKKIIALAVQRLAAEHTAETTVAAVALPSDEMKGRIIGREGRNIRALEQATGIDLIIDDTPETVIVSGFDPVRREIARLALTKLIQDGRIHPGRIEEVVA
jgi:ribonucrease Y